MKKFIYFLLLIFLMPYLAYSQQKLDLDKALELNEGYNKKLVEVINDIQEKINMKE